MDTALVGLVGVALGSALGWAGVWWTDRLRWQREDRQRWHGPRLKAYTTTLTNLTVLVVEFRSAIGAARRNLQPPWGRAGSAGSSLLLRGR